MPLKYLSNIWRTLEITTNQLRNKSTWSENCFITDSRGTETFSITDSKLYVPVVTLSTQDETKLLKLLKEDLNLQLTGINISENRIKAQNKYLNYLVDPSFQGVNRSFVSSFENNKDRIMHTGYYNPKVEIKDYNIVIDGRKCFD